MGEAVQVDVQSTGLVLKVFFQLFLFFLQFLQDILLILMMLSQVLMTPQQDHLMLLQGATHRILGLFP